MATTIKSLSKTKRSFSQNFRRNVYSQRQPTFKTRFNDPSSSTFLYPPSNNYQNSKSSALNLTDNHISSLKPNVNIEQTPLNLRRQLDNLQRTLLQQRTSSKLLKGCTNRMKEKLKTEFSDEINFDHLGSKGYLLQGVKSQYYRMKEKLEQKNHQCEELLRMKDSSFMEEAKLYYESLQIENSKLRKMLQSMLNTQQYLYEKLQSQLYEQNARSNIGFEGNAEWKKQQQQKIASLLGVSAIIISLQKRKQDLQQEVKVLKQKCKLQAQSIRQKKDKIIYLKRTLKSSQFDANNKNVELYRENKRLNESLEQLRSIIGKQEDKYRVWIYVLIEKEKKKYENKAQILLRYLRESQEQVEKLKEQLKKSKSLIGTTKLKNTQIKGMKQSQGNMKVKAKISVKEQQQLFMSQMKQQQSCVYYAKLSHIKHSKQCFKVRPVIIQQLEDIQRQLQYRLIYYRIPSDQLKKYIDPSFILVNAKDRQRYRYFKQKDLKAIFQQYPFNLSQSNAILVARYVVEDPSKGDVYYHQENQVDKIVAQSIIKSLIGEYMIPSEQQSKIELFGIMKSFRQNIESALTSYTKDGLISQKKLRDILEGINIKISYSSWKYLMSQLMAFSHFGLEKLNSKLIFALF